MTTRQQILLATLLLGGKSTYGRVLSFMSSDYRTANYYGMLARMEADGLVSRRAGMVVMRPAGLRALAGRLGPRIRALEHRSGGRGKEPQPATVIVYDFPIDKSYLRSRLKARLSRLGCVALRDGVYVSAYDVRELVALWAEEHDALPRVWCVRVPLAGDEILPGRQAGPIGGLLRQAWDLPDLAERYRRLLDRLVIVRGIQVPQKKKSGIRRIRQDFLQIIDADPLLPAALQPPDWPFDRVRESILQEDE